MSRMFTCMKLRENIRRGKIIDLEIFDQEMRPVMQGMERQIMQ